MYYEYFIIFVCLFFLLIITYVLYINSQKSHNKILYRNGVTSYQDISECTDRNIVKLHNLLIVNHDKILVETSENSLNFKDNSSTERSPTLSSIIALFKNIISAKIHTFYPGTITIADASKEYRKKYCYGLKVEQNDIGLKIGNFDVKWEFKGGCVWDSNLPYAIWNHTIQPRIIIMVEIY